MNGEELKGQEHFVGENDLIYFSSDYCLSCLGVCRVLWECYSSLRVFGESLVDVLWD